MKHGYLYLCVFVSGASVLAVEILGTRILGPFYGVSLYLWSALITITLAALSTGYALGGILADRSAAISRLSSIMAVAGIWLFLVPWIRQPVLEITESLGLRSAVLLSALILFFPPLMLLGMISPYAVKLRTASLGEVGRSAGNLYAISTIASVGAALLTGFILIPSFGVSRLTLSTGVVLLLTASIGLFRKSRGAMIFVPAVLLIGGAAAVSIQHENTTTPDRGLLHMEQSPYGEIRVLEKEGMRYLLIDGGIHTMTDPSTLETLFPYVNVIDLAQRFFDEPGELLLIGLGGGSVVKHFANEGWRVDAVEIDPAVIRIAHSHFGLEPGEAKVFHTDGRRYLITRKKSYDIIVLDAFGSSSIPFHLVTKEVFGIAASRLNPGGILAINVESRGWRDLIVRSLAATLKEHFSRVIALPTAEPPGKLGNVVLFASNADLKMPEELPAPESRFSDMYDRVHAWDNRFEPDTGGVPVLTDDLNPVDLWTESINLAARTYLHEYFGRDDAAW